MEEVNDVYHAAEMGFSEIVNIFGCAPKVQHQRLLARGYNDQKIAFKNDLQFSTEQKKRTIENEISKSCYGHVFEINNENDGSEKLRDWLGCVLNLLRS